MRERNGHKALFSEREGLRPKPKEISIRNDAPRALREALPQLVYSFGWAPSRLRYLVCKVLLVAPDRDNWTEYPNVAGEVDELLQTCEWYRVYDVAEAVARKLDLAFGERDRYEEQLNGFLGEHGIGWQLEETALVYRGGEAFQEALTTAEEALTEVGYSGAATRLREAVTALSRRPDPDAAGAVTHAIAALEAAARELDGRREKTLGTLIQAMPVPDDLRDALRHLWKFSSNYARHGREDQVVTTDEAELVVTVAGGVCTFICRTQST